MGAGAPAPLSRNLDGAVAPSDNRSGEQRIITITIGLPEDLADRAAAAGLLPDDLGHFAIAEVAAGVSAVAKERGDSPPDGALLADLSAAAAEMEEDRKAGRLLTLEQLDAEFEAAFASRDRKKAA